MGQRMLPWYEQIGGTVEQTRREDTCGTRLRPWPLPGELHPLVSAWRPHGRPSHQGPG